MTIRVTRLHRQHFPTTVEVYLDDKRMVRLAPGVTDEFTGSGRAQQLVVRSPGFTESEPIEVTDPKHDLLLGVVISYVVRHTLFHRGEKVLSAEVMGAPTKYLPVDPL